jgi:dihydroorotate dehydrogenase electron transfer subunit
MPLVNQVAQSVHAVALFTDASLPPVPSSLEVHPLVSFPEAVSWPDFVVIDLPIKILPELRGLLGLNAGEQLPCPAQVLISIPMPCGGIGECSACAVDARRGWKLACKDGPVFNLDELEW